MTRSKIMTQSLDPESRKCLIIMDSGAWEQARSSR